MDSHNLTCAVICLEIGATGILFFSPSGDSVGQVNILNRKKAVRK